MNGFDKLRADKLARAEARSRGEFEYDESKHPRADNGMWTAGGLDAASDKKLKETHYALRAHHDSLPNGHPGRADAAAKINRILGEQVRRRARRGK